MSVTLRNSLKVCILLLQESANDWNTRDKGSTKNSGIRYRTSVGFIRGISATLVSTMFCCNNCTRPLRDPGTRKKGSGKIAGEEQLAMCSVSTPPVPT
jgi:hypothetical protein